MNQKFFDLPKEKQQLIINSALAVFSKYDYKKASTDEIVQLAGISKGLLFHYFESKKNLYLFLYEYATKLFVEQMSAFHNYTETDFFKILVDAQMCKIRILSIHPNIMLFIVKAYFENADIVKSDIEFNFNQLIYDSRNRFLQRADTAKFKNDVSPERILDIILWMSDGYMRSRTPKQLSNLEALNREFLDDLELLRQHFYKPEFL